MTTPRNQGEPPQGAKDWHDDAKFVTMMEFEQLFYDSADTTWQTMTWMGIPIQKNPCDLWIYQELIYRIKPTVIIETGTLFGGSALYLAHLLDLMSSVNAPKAENPIPTAAFAPKRSESPIGQGAALSHVLSQPDLESPSDGALRAAFPGRVITVDCQPRQNRPFHPLISYVHGNSADVKTTLQVEEIMRAVEMFLPLRVMVILDSDHEFSHVLREMELYSGFVTPGSYLIVEDTNLNGHPVWSDYGPGPREAIEQFIISHNEFMRDAGCERLMLSFNRGGYLRRRA